MSKKNEVSQKGRELALAEIKKKYGAGACYRMLSNEVVPIETFPSGSLSLDLALGIHGYPVGRIIEIYGPESSGKTTLALHAAAEVQKKGGDVAFIDAEHALDMTYAQNLGVQVDKLDISQPGSGEEALDIAIALTRSGAYRLIVVDSVSALVPLKELEGDMSDANMGLQARMMSKAMRILTSEANNNNCTIIIIINFYYK